MKNNTEEKKYELIELDGGGLYRIRAVRDFGFVKTGDMGGFVEGEHNLSHDGTCWIYDNALVYDNARVQDDARIFNRVHVCGSATISGKARFYNDVYVFGKATVSGNVRIYDEVRILGGVSLYGDMFLKGSATISDVQ